MIRTARLILTSLQERHRREFAEMHCDPDVMADLGGPFDQGKSDAKFDRYRMALTEHGISRWAIEDSQGQFLGYTGVMFRPDAVHPLGPHLEVGWRLRRCAWGQGYATEGASVSLNEAFSTRKQGRIFSYTSSENLRSQSVMRKLGLKRARELDFAFAYNGIDEWNGRVWLAEPPEV